MKYLYKNLICIFCSFLALSALPCLIYANTLTYDDARHLLIRTEFCAQHERITQFKGLTKSQAAKKLIRQAKKKPYLELPERYLEMLERFNRQSTDKLLKPLNRRKKRKERRDASKGLTRILKEWWFEEMVKTDSPFSEKMTLFWHNHFVSTIPKTKRPDYILQQNLLFREHGLGNFRELLHKVAKDPAMILYLDNQTNRKGAPNENFAREVMELFTMGEGNYTEYDIKEAARAFTGWSINQQSGTFVKRKKQHDYGLKKVLGKRGHFDGEDIIEILLEQPETSEYITTKFWKEFVSLEPDPVEIKRLARIFRTSKYDISELMYAILTSDAFYATENRTALIKSPIDLIVGTLRQFNIDMGDYELIVKISRQLGQDIFNPPNVKGWPGGKLWINNHTLQIRGQFLERILRAQETPKSSGQYIKRPKKGSRMKDREYDIYFDFNDWKNHYPKKLSKQRENMIQTLVSGVYIHEFDPMMMTESMPVLSFVQNVVTSPYYQLK